MNKLWWIGAEAFQSGIPAPERHRLLQLMHLTRYDEKKVIYSCSLPGDVIYLIQQGSVILYQNTPAQTRRELVQLGSGELFGSLGLLEEGFKEGLAISCEPTIMLVLRKGAFEQLMKYFPTTGAHLVEFLQRELAAQRLERNRRHTPHVYRRLCRLLLHFLDHPAYVVGDKPVRMHEDCRELATLLGSRPDVVSDCLSRLEAAGILSRHHHELHLKDRGRLEKEVGSR
ncbi:MAG: Crp/Fnr family transcriptional regulator [Candidatus Sericytochromatia bacterium]